MCAVCHGLRLGYAIPVRRHLLSLAAAAGALLVMSAPAAADTTTLPAEFQAPCPLYGGVQICSGSVPSFDHSKLDVDLSLPTNGGGSHPLIVMLHGFGNNKREWESLDDTGDGADKWHWNSHWFATHGYYVLAYTARGFRDDEPPAAYEPPTPADPTGSVDAPNGTIHVKSRDYEIRDTQWLAALVAATFPDVDPSQVAVTGGSYGGGESWMQASQATWDFPHSQDASLPVLQLQVAVPKYPWTDLAYSLAPNGHGGGPSRADIYESSQTMPENNTGGGTPATGNPLGVPKASYIAGLFALGTAEGVFDEGSDFPPTENDPENIPAWNARITGAGDPYVDGDPVLQQAAIGLTELRSSYYQDEGWNAQLAGREVAVYSVQGWTDDLFEAVESFRQFKYLKRLDPRWPVDVEVADIGHSRAQNKPETWRRINVHAWGFLQSQINGSHRIQSTVRSQNTVCDADPGQAGSSSEVTGSTPEDLSNGTLTIAYGGGDHTLTNPLGAADPNGPATDPVVGGDIIEPGQPCRTSTEPVPVGAGYTGTSEPLGRHTEYVGLGEVDVDYTLDPPAVQAQLDARVWDVPPSGPAFLITRGTYRLDTLNGYDKPAGTLRLPLWGNDWQLPPGHKIRLDLTQVDAFTLRANNLPSSITYGTPRLVLPTRESGEETLAGTP
jgi:dienelactone hydrolase